LTLRGVQEGGASFVASGTPDNVAHNAQSMEIAEQHGTGPRKTYRQTFETRITPGTKAGDPASLALTMNLDPPSLEPYELASLVRHATDVNLAAGYSALRLRGGSLDLLQSLKSIDERISGLEILVINGRSELHVSIGDVLLPFQVLGDGPVALAKTLVSLAAVRGGVLLIDEVGEGIHHSLYPTVWQILHRAAERLDVQIVATTHSGECLDAAFESLRKRPNELKVYRMQRSKSDDGTDVRDYEGAKLASAINMNAELR